MLWHLEVEGQKPADVAPLLGLSANSVSALAYRAREGLRQAYLQMHMADTADEECRWVTERLGAHVRKGLSRRDAQKVDQHLEECPRCAAVYLELTEVNSNLSAIVGPLLLGGAAAAYISTMSASAGSVGTLLWLSRTRHLLKANGAGVAGVAAGAAVVAGVAAAVIVGAHKGGTDNTSSEGPPTVVVGTSSTSEAGTSSPQSSDQTNSSSREPNTSSTSSPTAPVTTITPPPPVTTPPSTSQASTDPRSTDTGGPSSTGNTSTDPTHTDTSTGPTHTTTTDPPSTTTTTTTTTPPPPPTVDVELGMSIARVIDDPGRYTATLSTSTKAPATALTMTIALSEYRAISVGTGGWACTSGGDSYVCTTNSASPGDLTINVAFGRGTAASLSASVTAADNDDPNSGNNSVSWTGGG